jgi:endonuclease YncB( thermonuclease family)/DNA-binding transcriptional ArsR family regulator
MSGLASTDGQETYEALRQDVADVLAAGKEQARQAVESVRVATYSQVGERIHIDVLAHQDRADYGDRVIGRLAEDVGLSRPTLYDALRLYRAFGKVNARLQLGWTHYRRLLRLPNQKERLAFQQAAIMNGWSVRELESQIKAGASAGQIISEPGDLQAMRPPRLVAKRGELDLYRVQEDEDELILDVGFKEGPPLSEDSAARLGPGDTVRVVRDSAGLGYRLKRTDTRKQYYSYRATVHRIIDGDTLWAKIDFGLDWTAKKKLRLRGIDSPEIKTEAGVRAKAHLERVLAEAQPFVITTTKVDLYDRYLTDVYILPGESDLQKVAREGRFLNRELIEAGFARRWTKEKPPEF